jgi:Flp pilus assembly CpaF family ATPase
MAANSLRPEAVSRGARMLRTALGSAIAAWLEDPAIIEVMLNPDGRIWIDRLTDGLADTGEFLAPADGERIIRLVAHHVGAEVHSGSPRVSAELPETGERFEGLLPPIVAAPAFAIRKPAVAIFMLEDYAGAGIMSTVPKSFSHCCFLSRCLCWRQALRMPPAPTCPGSSLCSRCSNRSKARSRKSSR